MRLLQSPDFSKNGLQPNKRVWSVVKFMANSQWQDSKRMLTEAMNGKWR
jgi:hypothetical protein